jgi:hypothetical protein
MRIMGRIVAIALVARRRGEKQAQQQAQQAQQAK